MKKILRISLLALLIGVVLFSLAVQVTHRPEEDSLAPRWELTPGFFILFGFLGCLALIALGLGLGRILLIKKERYYDHD